MLNQLFCVVVKKNAMICQVLIDLPDCNLLLLKPLVEIANGILEDLLDLDDVSLEALLNILGLLLE